MEDAIERYHKEGKQNPELARVVAATEGVFRESGEFVCQLIKDWNG